MGKFQAAIFDMDGLLIDSMIHWLELDRKWFSDKGLVLTEETITYFTGRSIVENVTYLKENFGFTETVEDLMIERRSWEEKIYSELTQEMIGATQLIKKIKNSGIRLALASGAPMTSVDRVVDKFSWREYFDVLISSEHVNHVGKPDPAIFLHAAEQLGVKSDECIVFEDAENGVIAAKRAGMSCIAVPDERWSFGDFSKADLIVKSLEDRKISDFLGLI